MEVAVLVTNYNHSDFIVDCIKSIQCQSYSKFKAFIIDDKSSDDSVNIIINLIKDDNRFQLLTNKINLGKSKSLNILVDKFKISNYDFVALLDSDDIWLEHKLEKQINFLISNKNFDVSYTEGNLFYSNKYDIESWGSDKNKKLFSDIHRVPNSRDGNILDEFLKGNFVFYSSLMLRGFIFKKHEFNNLIRRSMDWLFLIEISKNHEFGYLEEPVARYRIHDKNLQAQINKTHEVILPRLFVVQNYKSLMSRRTIANHYYALSRSVIDIKQKHKNVDFLSYFVAGFLHYPNLKKSIKLLLNYIKSIFN